jgi:hypothetical protein
VLQNETGETMKLNDEIKVVFLSIFLPIIQQVAILNTDSNVKTIFVRYTDENNSPIIPPNGQANQSSDPSKPPPKVEPFFTDIYIGVVYVKIAELIDATKPARVKLTITRCANNKSSTASTTTLNSTSTTTKAPLTTTTTRAAATTTKIKNSTCKF